MTKKSYILVKKKWLDSVTEKFSVLYKLCIPMYKFFKNTVYLLYTYFISSVY